MTGVSSIESALIPAARTWPLVAVQAAPRIVCPDWCNVSEAHHVAALRDNDGVVFHESDYLNGWSRTVTTFVDGTPVPGEPPRLYADGRQSLEGITVGQAKELAESILAAVDGARA